MYFHDACLEERCRFHRINFRQVLGWLFITILLGLGFIGMEVSEFRHMILAGNGQQQSAFLSAFFTLVGTHGLHVSFGLIGMLVIMAQVMRKGLTVPVQSRLIRLSMFWHFLDIVWIGIFTVLIIAIMLLGTLWIMFDLHFRMM